ncbi:Maf family protein [Cohaesibacter celericrescens]|uniref:Nucleoside triphosphate pyrophosphatase n=1 Tax=Cohaesibacter celericrescens TaxID=2067669 RepID=A0A2N5XP33_9HYPH|nr:Maf family protein [Cohaesibacter celericrescens]PLW76253.1 septum formation inhibitor Maf [Cohaesibacter celericrescens]
MDPLILASKSQARSSLLRNAGLSFDCVAAEIDERAAEQPLVKAGGSPQDIAELLAEVKAVEVSNRYPGHLVIGADQTLGFGAQRFNKPQDDAAARAQLLDLAGESHQLHSAVACVKDGQTLWRYISTATLTMRPLSPQEIGRYMARVGEPVRSSVGCYQLEGLGVQLFEKIDGDYFTILGLPLLPLLGYFRDQQGLEF